MKLKSAQEYKSWKKIIKMAKSFPVNEHTEELKTLHSNRSSRSLSTSKVNIDRLVTSSSQDIHVRSRCVQLMVIAKKNQWLLDRANEAMRDYIFDREYVKGKTQAEKVRSANFQLKDGIDQLNQLEYFIDICEDFIQDIDKTAWQLKLIFEGISTASKGEMVL